MEREEGLAEEIYSSHSRQEAQRGKDPWDRKHLPAVYNQTPPSNVRALGDILDLNHIIGHGGTLLYSQDCGKLRQEDL